MATIPANHEFSGASSARAKGLPLLLPLALLLTACVSPAAQGRDSGPGAQGSCSTVGQPCEFVPGKLGTCVRRDDCAGDACFVCQSQH